MYQDPLHHLNASAFRSLESAEPMQYAVNGGSVSQLDVICAREFELCSLFDLSELICELMVDSMN
jgi:hypothetical protein